MYEQDLDVVCDLDQARVVGRGEGRGSHFSTARVPRMLFVRPLPITTTWTRSLVHRVGGSFTIWGSHREATNKDQYWFADTELRRKRWILGGGPFVDSGKGQTALLGICYLISSLGLHFKLQCSLFNLGILQSQEAELTTH